MFKNYIEGLTPPPHKVVVFAQMQRVQLSLVVAFGVQELHWAQWQQQLLQKAALTSAAVAQLRRPVEPSSDKVGERCWANAIHWQQHNLGIMLGSVLAAQPRSHARYATGSGKVPEPHWDQFQSWEEAPDRYHSPILVSPIPVIPLTVYQLPSSVQGTSHHIESLSCPCTLIYAKSLFFPTNFSTTLLA